MSQRQGVGAEFFLDLISWDRGSGPQKGTYQLGILGPRSNGYDLLEHTHVYEARVPEPPLEVRTWSEGPTIDLY